MILFLRPKKILGGILCNIGMIENEYSQGSEL